jgi:superfamily II RNA helicase
LARLLEKGVAFHHSGLLPVLKEIVEILFSKGFVKVLFATETFAVGINMPTKTVVFTSYQKHDAHGYRMLRSDEYIQMAGRAGRRGKDTEGLVLYLPDREAASLEEVQKMMNGQQQRVSSKMDFGYDFLIKTFYGNAINWKDILEKSYWFQQRQESIDILQKDLKRKEEVRDTLQLSPEIVEELWVREGIDARIQNGANAGRKKALREMESWKGEHIEAKWEIAWKSFGRWKEVCKEIAILQSTIEDLQTVDPLIQPRIAYLKHHQYLDGDLGRLAANIHEGHPLLLPLAFRKRVFHDLSREQLVGCLSLFADGEGNVSFIDVSEIDDTAIDAVLKLQTLSEELQDGEPIASPESYWSLSYYWYDVVVRWMRGENLSAICQSYQIHEGNAVRALLKVSNLADEWITMATLAGDTEQLELLKDIRAQLVRDSVVPDSLYLHI